MWNVAEEEEELIKSVFDTHKEWVEDSIEAAKQHADECNTKRMLESFYRGILALKGLEAVFTVEIPEVTKYSREKKAEIRTKDIPDLVKRLEKCVCKI